MEISRKLTKQQLRERLEWMLKVLEENQMQSALIWSIYNNFHSRFSKTKDEE